MNQRFIAQSFPVVLAWVYDKWKYYPGSLYLGAASIILSCVVMLYPWHVVRRQRSKDIPLPRNQVEYTDTEMNRTDSPSALKNRSFVSMESVHSYVSLFSYTTAIEPSFSILCT